MTTPWAGPGLSPLQLYLREERSALAVVAADLQDAAADAQRRITRLAGRQGIGAVVRRAQLTQVRAQLVAVQRALWAQVGERITATSPALAAAAAEAERAIEAVLFRAVGRTVPEALITAQQAYATRTARAYFARSDTKLPLSRQVYRSRQLTQGWVDREINRAILQGGSWHDLASRVRGMIQPETPGGVSFAAKRLARTELNNAFHEASKAVSAANPYSAGMRWYLSGSHPRVDACDALARGHSRGRSTGVYDDGAVPRKPHPQCLCFVASVPIAEDDFIRLVTTTPPSTTAATLRGLPAA